MNEILQTNNTTAKDRLFLGLNLEYDKTNLLATGIRFSGLYSSLEVVKL